MGLFVLMRWLAFQPFLDATWRVEANDVVELVSSPLPQLKGLNGRHLERISGSEGHTVDVDASLLHRSPRWSVNEIRVASSPTRPRCDFTANDRREFFPPTLTF